MKRRVLRLGWRFISFAPAQVYKEYLAEYCINNLKFTDGLRSIISKKWFVIGHFLFLLLLLSARDVFSQVSVHDAEIMQIKGKWTKHDNVIGLNDPDFPKSQYSFVYKKTDSIAGWLKQAYPSPTGLEAAYYTSLGGWPVCKGAPASYTLRSYYKSYYFNVHLNKILLADETSTAVRVYINDFGSLLHEMGEDWMIDGQPTKVFEILQRDDGNWNGLPLYKSESWLPGNSDKIKTSVVLITRDGKLPFMPLTQKQYLLALKYQHNEEKKRISAGYGSADKNYEKAIADIRNNNMVSADTKEKLIASLEKDHEKYMKEHAGDGQKLVYEYDRQIKIIDDYLSSHSTADLQQSVVTSWPGDFRGYFGADKNKPASTPVCIDPSYFNSSLPKYIPQFIVIEWGSEPDAPGSEFKKQFENNFQVAKLKAMVGAKVNDDKIPDKAVVVGPDLAAIRKQAERYADSVLKNKYSLPPSPFTAIIPADTTFFYKVPARNEKMLNAIPKKTFTTSELKTYITNLEEKLTPILHSSFATPVVNTDGYDVNTIIDASLFALEMGLTDQAVLLSLRAAERAPGDPVVLNNVGSMLQKGGLEIAAIPILKSALEDDPGNSTIQNNLGQSYLSLGDREKGEQYLRQCVSKTIYHPLANSSLAFIYLEKGNKQTALKYTENSLRGAFTDKGWHLLLRLKKDASLMDYLRHRYKEPEYFNEDKYKLPRQCEQVADIPDLEGEYKAYEEMIVNVESKFKTIEDEEFEKGLAEMTQNAKKGKVPIAPFEELAAAMMLDRQLRMNKNDWEDLYRAYTINEKEMSLLNEEYKAREQNLEGPDCGPRIELANKYMEKMAIVTREYQKATLPIYKDYYHDMAYWSFFATPNKHLRKSIFCGQTKTFLSVLEGLAKTSFLHLTIDCASNEELKKDAEEIEIEGNCPLGEDGIEIPFGIGKFNMSCEKVEFQIGEVLVLNVGHKFYTGETTWALGPGVAVSLLGKGHESLLFKKVPELKVGPLEGGVEAGIKGQAYLTFRDGNLLDWGGVFTTEIDILGHGKELKTGYTIGANSGLEMEPGPLRDLVDKLFGPEQEAPQINKNVRKYKEHE